MSQAIVENGKAPVPPDRFSPYDGTTYYGRAQLKPAPFENWVVGGYTFVAGLSGSAAILAALADGTGREDMKGAARRGRYLSLLAPIIGAPLLIYDLHTPKRFYNMFRVAKATSPMSIGTWILTSFSLAAGLSAIAQAASDLLPRQGWLTWLSRAAGVPAAVAGAGLSTYTASLLSATSTPVWAAAPRSLAMRFGSSSMLSAAAALALSEKDDRTRYKLEAIEAAALMSEAVAGALAQQIYKDKGVGAAFNSRDGATEKLVATGLGTVLPLGLLAVSAVLSRRGDRVAGVASVAAIMGSAVLRVSMLGVGDESAKRPDVSFRFSTPANLPR